MRKLTFSTFVAVLLSLLAVTPAMANPIFTPGEIVTLQFLGPNGATASGIYVGPYHLLANGQPVDLICNDPYPADEIYQGNTWLARVSDYSNLSLTRFGGRPNAVQLYGLIGVLDLDMFAVGPSSYRDDHTASLNFVQSSFPMTPGGPARQQWALGQLGNVNLGGMQWFTPVNSQGNTLATGFQEFGFGHPVPEPLTLFLAGAGLIGLGLLKRRRKTATT